MESTERAGLSAAQRWLLTLSCLAVVLVIASTVHTATGGCGALPGAAPAPLLGRCP